MSIVKRLETIVRPSLIVFILYAAIIFTMVGFGMWMIWGGEMGSKPALRHAIGVVSMALGLGFGRNVGELCSVKIDDGGVSQLKIMRKKRLIFRARIDWKDQIVFVDDGIRIVLKNASTEVRINLSFFGDMHEVAAFIEDRVSKRDGN